jgi:hypothetical protein
MPKLQPAVMTLNFRLESGVSEGWLDISQCASIVNRRFYRQGLNWAVAGVTWQQNSATVTTTALRVETLPTTWVTSNAWHKMFAAWHRQQREALEDGDQESVLARFNDFKVFLDTAHVSAFASASSDLNATNLIPRTAADDFATGEWEPSQIVLPNRADDGSGSMVEPIEQYLHMVGSIGTDASASRGVLSAYAFSRSTPQSPDPAVPSNVTNDEYNILRNMFDVGNDNVEVLDNAIRTNDELPYNQELYPGTYGNAPSLQLVSEHYLTEKSINNRVETRGFMAPCGLIKFSNDPTTGDAPTMDIQVHLVPGPHRGYLAEPMQDM